MKLTVKKLFLVSLCVLLVLCFWACGSAISNNESSEQADSQSFSVPESESEHESDYNSSAVQDLSSEDKEESSSSEASEDVTVCGDFGYVLTDDVAQLCAYYGEGTELDIPEELDGHTVAAITETAFAGNKQLVQINLGNSVINVAEGAFSGCIALEKVVLGNGVAVVYANSFDACPALTQIEVSATNGNYTSAEGILYNDDKSKLIRCPQGFSAEELSIPQGTAIVGEGAFKNCSGIEAFVLPADCILSADSFFHCDNMQSFRFEGSVPTIPDYCFFGCVLLEEIVLPDGVESLGEYAFFGCVGLKKLSIPASVISISDTAFDCCTGIEEADVKGDCATEWYSNYKK